MPATASSTAQWRVTGKSVRGASHERSGLPNQDAIAWAPESGAGSRLIVAVADGHGSARSFRSQTGAEMAVHTAISTFDKMLQGDANSWGLSTVKRLAEERIPQDLVQAWLSLVNTH